MRLIKSVIALGAGLLIALGLFMFLPAQPGDSDEAIAQGPPSSVPGNPANQGNNSPANDENNNPPANPPGNNPPNNGGDPPASGAPDDNANEQSTPTPSKSDTPQSQEPANQISPPNRDGSDNPCTGDNWDCSSIEVSGYCDGTVAIFVITNTGESGEGDMESSSQWRLYVDSTLIRSGTFQLDGGESTRVRYADGGEAYLQADQQPGHPGQSQPQAVLQCAPDRSEATATTPPTDTPTPVPPTDTPTTELPTDTPTPVSPTDTPTTIPPTDTVTPVSPTDTATPVMRDNLSETVDSIDIDAQTCEQWLVFHTNRTGNWELFQIGDLPDTERRVRNLSQGPDSYDVAPSISPDHEYVTFTSNRDGDWEIYISDADGSNLQQITRNDARDIDPVWSPVDSRIVYQSVSAGTRDLYLVNLATGDRQRLTRNQASNVNPFWSPDGSKLLFQSDRTGIWQVYELNLTTMKTTQLTTTARVHTDAQYNPTGDRIAFRRRSVGGNGVIYMMDTDGTDQRRISDRNAEADNLAWSPDGDLVAYQSNRDGDRDIYVHDTTSRQTRKLTDNDIADYAPTWFCESDTVVFTSDTTGSANIFAMDARPIEAEAQEVTNTDQLTTSEFADQYPADEPPEENASRPDERTLPRRTP